MEEAQVQCGITEEEGFGFITPMISSMHVESAKFKVWQVQGQPKRIIGAKAG